MAEKRLKPAIRFNGYGDAWELRKLGECFDERQERSAEGELISVTINDGIRRFSELGRHNNSSDDKSHYKKVEVGDIAYNSMRMWQGASGYSPYSGILSPAYTVVIPKSDVDSLFFSYVFKKPQMIHTFQISSQGITSDTWNLKYPAFSEIETTLPKIEEQKKIAEYFRNLDNLITLHQRKYDKLVNIKKSMLEKMFPQNGSNSPEIRFAGFTDAWELRKLSELADFSKGQGYTKSDLRESGTPIILYGRLYTKYQPIIREVDTFADVIPGAVFSKGGEVILPSSGETSEDIAIASSVDKSGFLLGGGLNVVFPHEELQSAFIAIELSYGTPHNALAKRAQGKSVVHLYNEDLKQVSISFPSTDEQAKISSFFDNIDNLITLHQRELEKLQNIKKSCLEKMFV